MFGELWTFRLMFLRIQLIAVCVWDDLFASTDGRSLGHLLQVRPVPKLNNSTLLNASRDFLFNNKHELRDFRRLKDGQDRKPPTVPLGR